jgi:hypothetical protein
MPPNPFSMNQSSGQSFTTRGRASRAGAFRAADKLGDFDGAIEDMAAISSRLLVMGRDAAVDLADRLTDNTKEAIRRHMPPSGWRPRGTTGEPFEFSKGRIAAAFGRYTPHDMRGQVDENDSTPIQQKHEEWAMANGVAESGSEGTDIGEEISVEMGAITEIRRVRSNAWSAEVGTLLPYGPLANDGGSMWIQPYGNPNARPVLAEWEGVHFVEEGVARTEGEVDIIEGSIQAALDARTSVKKRRRRA